MKTINNFSALAALGLLSFATAAHAQFTGYYAPANFALTNGNSTTGYLDGANAPSSVTLYAPAEGGYEFRFTQIDIAVPAAGTVSLDYAFSQNDTYGGDTCGYTLNGAPTDLIGYSGSGSLSLAVSAGGRHRVLLLSSIRLLWPRLHADLEQFQRSWQRRRHAGTGQHCAPRRHGHYGRGRSAPPPHIPSFRASPDALRRLGRFPFLHFRPLSDKRLSRRDGRTGRPVFVPYGLLSFPPRRHDDGSGTHFYTNQ